MSCAIKFATLQSSVWATVLVVVLASAASADSPWLLPDEREADFDALTQFVEARYCYLSQKSTDWSAVKAHYRPLARVAKSEDALIRVLEQTLDELYDSHVMLNTNLSDSWRIPPGDIWAIWRGEQALVGQVRAGSNAEAIGLRAGAIIVSVDGLAVREAAKQRLPHFLLRADPAAEQWALLSLLSGRHDRPLRLKLSSGTELAITESVSNTGPVVSYRELPHHVGYIRIASFADDVSVGQFDAALAQARSTQALIIDVRANRGGDTAVAGPIMGRFIATELPYAMMARRLGNAMSERWTERVSPRGPFRYDRPLVVLVDHFSASMAEGFAMGLSGMKRAKVVGTPMAALGAGIVRTILPVSQLSIQISGEPVFQLNGQPRDAFLPDVTVANAPRSERDPILATALSTLALP